MTTIHTESIWAWAHNSRKPFGMGCYGFLPTLDMMRMMAIAVGRYPITRESHQAMREELAAQLVRE